MSYFPDQNNTSNKNKIEEDEVAQRRIFGEVSSFITSPTMALLIKNDSVSSFKMHPLSNKSPACVVAADSTPSSSSRAIFHSEES